MQRLLKAIDELRDFAKHPALKAAIDELAPILIEANRNNLEALINVGCIDENERNICDMRHGEGYDIVTGTYKTKNGDEYTEGARAAKIEELEIQIEELEGKLDGLRGAAKDSVEEKLEKVREEKDELDSADFEYDECMWNTVWRYNDSDPDHEIAKRLGLGVLHTNDDDNEWLFLTGCGMNLSPLIVAYKALVYGSVAEDDVRQFREPKYFKYVVGDAVFKEVCQKLGIESTIEDAQTKADKRMDDFNNSLDAITKARGEGKLDSTIAGFAAMAAFAKSEA